MRLLSVAPAALVLFACGGGTPSPKDPTDEAAGSRPLAASNKQPDSDVSAKSAAGAGGSGAPSTSASSGDPASPPPAAETKPAAEDDVWLAPHQMPPGDVLKTIRPSQAKVQGCYRAGVKRDPSTSGEVKVRFVITHEGQVRAWRDDGSSMNDEEVTKCVGELIKNMKFPKQKSPGDAWGAYSINFNP